MADSAREWKSSERMEVLLLAILPPLGACVLTLFLFLSQPRIWLFAFAISAVGAYVTSFLGVMPLLFLFRQYGWQHWLHFAVAGFLGVLIPWFVVGLAVGLMRDASLSSSPSLVLLLAACIGGAMAAIFGVLRRRAARV